MWGPPATPICIRPECAKTWSPAERLPPGTRWRAGWKRLGLSRCRASLSGSFGGRRLVRCSTRRGRYCRMAHI
eukprot:8022585-Alexandrium_andersonii.AAC.1